MAVFRNDASEWQRLDWRVLQNSPIAMYLQSSILAEDTAWLAGHGYQIDRFDCSRWPTEAAAHDELATTLALPDYYGRNLDALNDCLSEIEVPDDGGRCLVFTRYDALNATLPRMAAAIVEIVATQSRRKLLFGERLLALVQSNDPRLELAPVGAWPVM